MTVSFHKGTENETGGINVVLSPEDGRLFYKLFLPLLVYVDETYKMHKDLPRMAWNGALDMKEVKEIANRLWDDVSLLDNYVAEQRDMSQEEKDILLSWKGRIRGKFVLLRHLQRGSVFISEEKEVYQVLGIQSSWEELFPEETLPVFMEATLLPFRDVIISDGVVIPRPVRIPESVKEECQSIYLAARKSKTMRRTL